MNDVEQKICAHVPCGCVVRPGEKYCGESCKDAGSGEVEIECECGHATCTMAGENDKDSLARHFFDCRTRRWTGGIHNPSEFTIRAAAHRRMI